MMQNQFMQIYSLYVWATAEYQSKHSIQTSWTKTATKSKHIGVPLVAGCNPAQNPLLWQHIKPTNRWMHEWKNEWMSKIMIGWNNTPTPSYIVLFLKIFKVSQRFSCDHREQAEHPTSCWWWEMTLWPLTSQLQEDLQEQMHAKFLLRDQLLIQKSSSSSLSSSSSPWCFSSVCWRFSNSLLLIVSLMRRNTHTHTHKGSEEQTTAAPVGWTYEAQL